MNSSLEQRSLVVQLADNVRGMIIQGRFGVGDEISEIHLADLFSVGRTTVREALRILTGEGFLEKDPRKTWRVKRLSDETIWEVAVVRAALEGLAAYLAAQLLTPKAEQQLRDAVEQMEKMANLNDLERFSEADLAFHLTLVDLADNRILGTCWRTIYAYSVLMIADRQKHKDDLEATVKMHWEMLDAILSRDAGLAKNTIRTKIFETYRRPDYGKRPQPWPAEETESLIPPG